MALTVTKVVLLLVSTFGWYTLYSFGYQNGSLPMVSQQRESGRLGDTAIPYIQSFTGIPRVDQHLNVLLTFFWPLVDGSRPDASLHSFYFAGQGISIWLVTQVEGLRSGNKWHVVSFGTTFGLLFQAIGMAIVGPFFLFVHLMTSPTVSTPNASNLTVDPNELLALPLSTIIGFILPTVLMSLHAPTYLTYERKAFFIRLWQIFPVLCYVSQHFWKRVLPLVTRTDRPHDVETQLRLLRKVYIFGAICASVAHVGAWTLSLTAYMFPKLFAREVVASLLPGSVFLPTMPWSGAQAESIGTGVHWFLQWDELLTSTIYLLWAYGVNTEAKVKYDKRSGLLRNFIGLLGYVLVVGPAGASLCVLWERDEIVLGDALKEDAKIRGADDERRKRI